MLSIDDLSEMRLDYSPVEFIVREATAGWERDGAHALRRAVFCIEQGIFVGDDRDAVDERARLLVAMACIAGMPEQVVGTVRIHEEPAQQAGLWWGSRLAVHPAFRSQGHLGATLIRLAVSRAHAQGCTAFRAHVQRQNVPLFEKLHWQVLGDVAFHGRPHAVMAPELAFYPPCHDPASGLVSRRKCGSAA
ncbi:MAG: GNAT family N-acetyltransferase [Comamonadaceae bacterium]|nr:MAG: GNAT family N-acetyltransferase [Comamonadaceae bacterium]